MAHVEANLVAVIMAGGVGTRFWPLSTQERPKQFLKLFDDRSLLQKSFDRIAALVPPERVMVLTGIAFAGLVREELPELPPENVIGEPLRRDTAAAVCLGATLCRKRFGNPVMVTLTADHLIDPVDVFLRTLLSAARFARESEALYTIGIPPSYAATSYGYLELGPQIADDQGVEHFKLVSFKEKPDIETARRYVESGQFHWNSGMFIWTVDAILRETERLLPEHLKNLTHAARFDRTADWPNELQKAFEALEPISIDYAVMEKAPDVRCVASKFTWADIGGWQALKNYLPQDEAGNACRGQTVTLDAKGNLVFCEDPTELVMLVGVKDLVAVRAGRKTLIAHKDRAEEIKEVVKKMQSES